MRNSKAKKIRKSVYGDQSQRQRHYNGAEVKPAKHRGYLIRGRQLVNTPGSLRAQYLEAKKLAAR
jgi:hypothetical protein